MTTAIFCHIPKTAGTSIRVWLRRQVPGIQLQDTHETALRRRERLVETMGREAGTHFCREHFSFTFIRNPWDRLVSLYHDNAFLNALGGHSGSFDAWLHNSMPFDHTEFDDLFCDQDTRNYLDQDAFFCDLEGTLLVEFVGRFEQLEPGWSTVCERLDIPLTVLPHANRGEHRPYREYYTPQTQKIVADRFGDFIERFKYSF